MQVNSYVNHLKARSHKASHFDLGSKSTTYWNVRYDGRWNWPVFLFCPYVDRLIYLFISHAMQGLRSEVTSISFLMKYNVRISTEGEIGPSFWFVLPVQVPLHRLLQSLLLPSFVNSIRFCPQKGGPSPLKTLLRLTFVF
jgi:hypothetical protein